MPDNSTASGSATGAGGLGLGERLRSARKARALSLERIAEGLHLDESIVVALEEERFAEVGAPVYVRGHLKAYAKLVDLKPEIVLDAYRKLEPQNPVVPAVERSVKRQVTVNPTLWGFSGLVLLLVAVLALYVLQDDAAEPPQAATAEMSSALPNETAQSAWTPEPIETTVLPVASRSPQAQLTRPAETIVIERVSTQPAAVPEAVEVARPSAGLVRLSLQFREESWVEISDANRRLLFGLQREGRHRDLAGEPPFRFLIGNAAGVDLRVNDEPYVVPPAGITGKVARFEIDAAAIE